MVGKTLSNHSSRSMQLSEIMSPSSRSLIPSKLSFSRDADEEDFITVMSVTNRNIERTRRDIQVLMSKATAYANNSGMGFSSPLLPSTPQRYGKSTLVQHVSPYVNRTPTLKFFKTNTLNTSFPEL